MKYTLITACLDSIATIEKTINSILIQKHLPYQFIVVDGGSKDGTIEYLEDVEKTFLEKGVNFSLIYQRTKGGIYEAWNLALSNLSSSSDLVFILNSDDWYFDNTVEEVLEYFTRDTKVEILCGNTLNFHLGGKHSISKNRSLNLFPLLMPINHPACFVRSSVYNKVGYFNDSYRVSGDYDFLFRCWKSDVTFGFTDSLLVNRLMGGYADSNKSLARVETLRIASANSRFSFFPVIAFLLRKIFGK